ncbi:hypothetical protein CH298_03605 [Rhodococcoides fascians]|uniref:hypothetical protein n=1 Tax=Rhodococcoides fascians TaxID=1828 RepID=UPI000B9B6B55|nr:hypothetical protein [Rhodococcus fascians]OZE92609.1 hypothetical protein CH303_03605 [Rhodococcus fascians]OZF23242.1 hypothetical protein CH298_03605 [Rhodococcus fascians]OZF24956.1 hypothetical protein CH297_03605 [Rhodococcus fascians]OZF72551.1 hypothetical protein CH308_03610 [Rhodococcus fascians]OZF73849.1 hypothetical protein CH307_03610 [Rhodococcus fascians]
MTSPATFPTITELAPNSRVLAVLDHCPLCGKENVKLQSDWSAYVHRSAVSDDMCNGPHPEAMFTLALRAAGLDARTERGQITHAGFCDDEWTRKHRDAVVRIEQARKR